MWSSVTGCTQPSLLLEQSAALPQELESALGAFNETARSLRLLAETLERQPQALLLGKGK